MEGKSLQKCEDITINIFPECGKEKFQTEIWKENFKKIPASTFTIYLLVRKECNFWLYYG